MISWIELEISNSIKDIDFDTYIFNWIRDSSI